MNNERGYSLFLLMFVVLLLSLLGSTVLTIAFADLRVSGHMGEAEQAYYYAEAGIEKMLAVMPRDVRELAHYEKVLDYEGSVRFKAEVSADEEPYVKYVSSVGYYGDKERRVEARAQLLPFGGKGLIAVELQLVRVNVLGGIVAEQVEFDQGKSMVAGDLWYGETMAGEVEVGGHIRVWDGPDFPRLDFGEVVAWAENEGWLLLPQEDEGYLLQGDFGLAEGLVVAGDVVIGDRFYFDGVLVVEGAATVNYLPQGDVLMLVKDEVRLAWEGEMRPEESLVIVSGERIINESVFPQVLNGVLFAPQVELEEMIVYYSDRAVLAVVEQLPEELVLYCPGFGVTWLETELRR